MTTDGVQPAPHLILLLIGGDPGSFGWVPSVPESPALVVAADSGLETGDILLQVGNVPVHQPEDVIDASFFISAGDAVPITVMRGEQKMNFTVQAGSSTPEGMALGPTQKTMVPLRLDSTATGTP